MKCSPDVDVLLGFRVGRGDDCWYEPVRPWKLLTM